MVVTVEFLSAVHPGKIRIRLRVDDCRRHLHGLSSSIAHLTKTSLHYSKQ
jgi:hypothetical protein